MARLRQEHDVAFEDALQEDWSKDLDIVEVPLGNRPLLYLGAVVLCLGILVLSRIFYFSVAQSGDFVKSAQANIGDYRKVPAPRGIIYDAQGDVLAENKAVFAAFLDPRAFLSSTDLQTKTLAALRNTLHLSEADVWRLVSDASKNDFETPIVLAENLDQPSLVALRGLDLPTIQIESDFERHYPEGPAFASVLGYTGRASAAALKSDSTLEADDFVGKAGVESFYDKELRGSPGLHEIMKDAAGKVLAEEVKANPQIGGALHLTIDGGLQKYFYGRMAQGLAALGRRVGVGIAINPQNGEVLSLVNLPGYDDNVFTASGSNADKVALFSSADKPLFDRAVAGFYSPGSTIKPLVGVAALKEGVIDPSREIFSPGYLDVPNPYDDTKSSRYLDWRWQGNVNLASAIAQSSDVYFYIVGGGSPPQSTAVTNDPSDYGIKGLGISRLDSWWQKFGLGKPAGIDMPGEAAGFLPTPDWKAKKTGAPWLLGDTYNVSIGQGDLLVTPIQLLDYISAIANGGTIYRPFLNSDLHPQVLADLTDLLPQIKEVQKGMRETVTSPMGTAYTLNDLGFTIGAKTGSAQVKNNQQENALFVGYAPFDHPQVAILILIENSKEGSLNAVPIAKDVLNWYYQNRIRKNQ